MQIDLHQHQLPPALVDRLRRRRTPPFLQGDLLTPVAGEPFRVSLADPPPWPTAGPVVLSLSPAIGIETLPEVQLRPLLDAWHGAGSANALLSPGAGEIGADAGHAMWASCARQHPDPEQLRADLGRPGVVGLQLPADLMATPAGVAVLAPVLEVAASENRPVFVHPAPAVAQRGAPGWWEPVVDYVGQLHAAWHAWFAVGAHNHPDLRIGFVALAGLAPLHAARRIARGGGAMPKPLGENVFYETSSYDLATVDAVAQLVGEHLIVHGSDLPNAQPCIGYSSAEFDHSVRWTNPSNFLGTPARATTPPTERRRDDLDHAPDHAGAAPRAIA